MIVLVTLVGLLSPAVVPPLQAPPLQALHCRIELAAGAKSRRCHVAAPGGGRAIRPCADADRQAGHCDAAGKGRYVAWVVGTGPGRCRITDKKTHWKRGVVSAKLSKSPGAPSTCDLYVELR
jgi:hypothetical protein